MQIKHRITWAQSRVDHLFDEVISDDVGYTALGATHDAADATMAGRVRIAFPAAARIRKFVNRVTVINVGLRGGVEPVLVEVSGQAVVPNLVVELPAQGEVRKGTALNASRCSNAVSSKVFVLPEIGPGQVRDFIDFVPVRHATSIATLLANHALVNRHVITMERKERSLRLSEQLFSLFEMDSGKTHHSVDIVGLVHMRPLKVIPTADCPFKARLRRGLNQAEIRIDVSSLLL